MKYAIDSIGVGLFMLLWLAGVVLAQGWFKILATVFPPYALYLVLERLMQFGGLL